MHNNVNTGTYYLRIGVVYRHGQHAMLYSAHCPHQVFKNKVFFTISNILIIHSDAQILRSCVYGPDNGQTKPTTYFLYSL